MNHELNENCFNTLSTLQSFIKIAGPSDSEFGRAAVIQAFEFTFEVYWKTFQKIARADGVTASGPKSALSYAYQANLIDDQEAWLYILNDRNMTTHTYHEEISRKIFDNIKTKHVTVFEKAYQALLKASR